MGGREPDTKVPKASAVQEQSPSKITCSGAAAYPDWSWFQAYSPMFPHGFFHSPMASTAQTHPFMWGAQHFMPPYGTPAPPYVMYPHGVYAHPSVQTCSVPSSTEADAKSSVSKEKNRPQKSKERSGSLNIFTGNENNLDKTSGAPNGVFSQSGDNGSEDSTEGSGANFRNDLEAKMGDRQESLDETSQNDTRGTTIAPTRSTSYHTMPMMPMPAAAAPGVVARPTANLNIGMEYWVSSTSSAIPPINGKVPATVSAGTVVPGALVGANEKIPPEIWLQDERELKRHRRKQSNRESARRSRLRKQAEYEELAQRVEVLKEENTALRTEVERIKKEFNELLAQNASLQERIEEETVEEGSIIEKSGLLVESGAARTVNSDS